MASVLGPSVLGAFLCWSWFSFAERARLLMQVTALSRSCVHRKTNQDHSTLTTSVKDTPRKSNFCKENITERRKCRVWHLKLRQATNDLTLWRRKQLQCTRAVGGLIMQGHNTINTWSLFIVTLIFCRPVVKKKSLYICLSVSFIPPLFQLLGPLYTLLLVHKGE